MSKEAVLTFNGCGGVGFVYEDAEAALDLDVSRLFDLGSFVTRRASHVEPAVIADGHWTADMRPMGGPVIGPFSLRKEALKAERNWLRDERGL
jgi:hypothetical protein